MLPDEWMERDLEIGGEHEDKSLDTLAQEIDAAWSEFRGFVVQATMRALYIGELLIAAKGRLDHGEWTAWLRENTELKSRTAQDWMYVARERSWLESTFGPARIADMHLGAMRQAIRDKERAERVARHERLRKEEVDTAVASGEVSEDEAEGLKAEIEEDAEKALKGKMKPTTANSKAGGRIFRARLPAPERRSWEAGERFREAYDAGDRFRARLQDLKAEDDPEWLGTMAAFRLAVLLVEIRGAVQSLMSDIEDAVPDHQQLHEAIEVEARDHLHIV